MGDHLVRAEEFEKKAEKKLNGWGLFGSKYEDAADLLEKAANSYKLAKSCNFFFLIPADLLCDSFSFHLMGRGCFWVVRNRDVSRGKMETFGLRLSIAVIRPSSCEK